ncbi:ectoine hydroxylase-related dioxygenase (phytanoyl-CoA dioxygenase family) [Bradyrhizobium sp. i1.4.4]
MTLGRHELTMPGAGNNLTGIVSGDDVQFFRDHGWWVSPQCLDHDLIDELAYGAERYLAGERDTPLPVSLGIETTETNSHRVRQGDYFSLQVDEAFAFVRHGLLPAIAAALAGSGSIRLFHDQLVYKPPAGPATSSVVGWHTDKAYWRSCTSGSMLTAWVPLQDTPLEMGPLAFWDRSHLWPGVEDLHTFDVEDLDAIEQRFARSGLVPVIEVRELRKGQVTFHHCRTVHGSYPNQVNTPRRAFAIHYQDEENEHNEKPGPDGRIAGHLNDVLCRRDANGRVDYSDPAICPRLWPTA